MGRGAVELERWSDGVMRWRELLLHYFITPSLRPFLLIPKQFLEQRLRI